jgi:hypothetical protein
MIRAAKLVMTLALLNAAPLRAQNMPLDTFLSKAEALQRKGPFALFSGDLALLKREMQGSAEQLKAARLVAVKTGQKPAYCPPAAVPLSSDEILAHFRSIPAPSRASMTTKDGFLSLMVKKYPCR